MTYSIKQIFGSEQDPALVQQIIEAEKAERGEDTLTKEAAEAVVKILKRDLRGTDWQVNTKP